MICWKRAEHLLLCHTLLHRSGSHATRTPRSIIRFYPSTTMQTEVLCLKSEMPPCQEESFGTFWVTAVIPGHSGDGFSLWRLAGLPQWITLEKCGNLSFDSARPKPWEPPSQFILSLAQTQLQVGERLRTCLQTQHLTPNTALCLPAARLDPSLISLHNYQHFREGRTIFWMGNGWTRPCKMNSLFWLSHLHSNKTFAPTKPSLHSSRITSLPFLRRSTHKAQGWQPQLPKSFPFPAFSSPCPPWKRQTKGPQSPAVCYVWARSRSSLGWGCLARASCWPLCCTCLQHSLEIFYPVG